MRKPALVTILVAGLWAGGCAAPDSLPHEGAGPGPRAAVPADEHSGPLVLANASEVGLGIMLPKGTPKSRVMEILGQPVSTLPGADGSSVQIYSHTVTSYRLRRVRSEALVVEYDRDHAVSRLTLSAADGGW